MSAVNKYQLEKEISRLGGFMSGIALMNGEPRHYSAGAYFLELGEEAFSVEDSLRNYYHWLPSLAFSSVQRLERGMRDFESEIGPFFVRDVSHMEPGAVRFLQGHLSFMAMEMLLSAIGDDCSRVFEVFHVSSACEPLTSMCDFFCVHIDGFLIVLQFNDDAEFILGRRKQRAD